MLLKNAVVSIGLATGLFSMSGVAPALGAAPRQATQLQDRAVAGDADAQVALGTRFMSDFDDENAVKWFRRAADQGHITAQGYLGMFYSDALSSLPYDPVAAYMWFSLAIKQLQELKNPTFKNSDDYDKLLSARDRIAARMTGARIAEAKLLARAWRPTPEK
jgi:hypothetical protein